MRLRMRVRAFVQAVGMASRSPSGRYTRTAFPDKFRCTLATHAMERPLSGNAFRCAELECMHKKTPRKLLVHDIDKSLIRSCHYGHIGSTIMHLQTPLRFADAVSAPDHDQTHLLWIRYEPCSLRPLLAALLVTIQARRA